MGERNIFGFLDEGKGVKKLAVIFWVRILVLVSIGWVILGFFLLDLGGFITRGNDCMKVMLRESGETFYGNSVYSFWCMGRSLGRTIINILLIFRFINCNRV